MRGKAAYGGAQLQFQPAESWGPVWATESRIWYCSTNLPDYQPEMSFEHHPKRVVTPRWRHIAVFLSLDLIVFYNPGTWEAKSGGL